MAAWLTRCDEPGLNILALTPDVLTLPCHPDRWSAVQADDQWLIRQDAWRGMAVETPWLAGITRGLETLPPIDCYSPPPATSVPLARARAAGCARPGGGEPGGPADLRRQGALRQRRWQPACRRWRPTLAAAAALALL